MSKVDYLKMTPDQLAELTPEEMKAAITAIASANAELSKTNQQQTDLLKDQAEQLAASEKAAEYQRPVIKLADGSTTRQFVYNLTGKFQHLNDETGMWELMGIEELRNTKTGLALCKALLKMKSNVITEIVAKAKSKKK